MFSKLEPEEYFMDFYIDVKLISNKEKSINYVLNEVYGRLHKELSALGSEVIGVSFPAYKVLLGNIIRIHGSADDLTKLQRNNWVGNYIAYCDVGAILPVPTDCKFRTVSRIQPSMSKSKLTRVIKRGSIPDNEIKEYRAKMFSKGLKEPYLELVSVSNGHKHRRYISFSELYNTHHDGRFDSFGLSKTATIPWFDQKKDA